MVVNYLDIVDHLNVVLHHGDLHHFGIIYHLGVVHYTGIVLHHGDLRFEYLLPVADHLIKCLIPITKYIQSTNTAPYCKYRPRMPNSHISKKQMHAFTY